MSFPNGQPVQSPVQAQGSQNFVQQYNASLPTPGQQTQQPVQQPAQTAPMQAGQTYVMNEQGQMVPVVAAQPQAVQQPQTQEPVVEVSDTAIAQVESFLKTAGISREQVEQEIEAFGKLTDGTKRALKEKHGAATANLIEGQVNMIAAQIMAKEAKLEQMQHNMVAEAFKGVTTQTPAESWMELLTWARTNIDVNTRAALNRMMQSSEFEAKQAVQYMIDALKQKQGVSQQGQLLNGDGAQGLGGGGDTLTASQYARELEAIVAKHGYESNERKQLDARRLRSQRNGY
ncbi:hypothetical protein [Vibrio phage JSF7]|uniref:Capsid and scaffold protein n=1 Tax=Vibrio phage JSF7 TaxID=1292086 RepID=A0A240EWW8_9CAUD|nr:head scaffolding protein [Vibrio phage JSF7]APD18161.1 hypothetical protein [Vibrio phage JSF7]